MTIHISFSRAQNTTITIKCSFWIITSHLVGKALDNRTQIVHTCFANNSDLLAAEGAKRKGENDININGCTHTHNHTNNHTQTHRTTINGSVAKIAGQLSKQSHISFIQYNEFCVWETRSRRKEILLAKRMEANEKSTLINRNSKVFNFQSFRYNSIVFNATKRKTNPKFSAARIFRFFCLCFSFRHTKTYRTIGKHTTASKLTVY